MSLEDTSIFSTLQTAVIAAVAASTMPDLGIKAAGRNFTPEADKPYVEIILIPNNRQGDFWGNEENYQGILRLIFHWPNDDQGIYGPLDLVKSVGSYFTKDKVLSGVQIYDNPKLTGVLEQGSENLYPVSIRYRKFQPST